MNKMLQKARKNISNILILSGVMRYNRNIKMQICWNGD